MYMCKYVQKYWEDGKIEVRFAICYVMHRSSCDDDSFIILIIVQHYFTPQNQSKKYPPLHFWRNFNFL
jgi:hypothetical protein